MKKKTRNLSADKLKEKSLKFLLHSQEKNGAFYGYLFEKEKPGIEIQKITFFTSLILEACADHFIDDLVWRKISSKAVRFLRREKSKRGSWNYWERKSDQYKEQPYPDDLDDTFCALGALHFSKEIQGEDLAKAIMLLTSLEIKEGGPYRTWTVSENAEKIWKDIDIAVNCNVAYFLSLQKVFLPSLHNLVEKSIREKKLLSPYYFNEIQVIYFISRFYRGNLQRELIQYLLSKQRHNHWGNLQDSALAISALLNLGYEKEKLKNEYAMLCHEAEKGFKVHPFLVLKNRTQFIGSKSLTCAFFLEAFMKFDKEEIFVSEFTDKNIYEKAKKEIESALPKEHPYAEKFLDEIYVKDKNKEITLLPYYFAKSFPSITKKSFCDDLALASLYGWLAFTIYDNVLDQDGGGELLPLGNFAFQRLREIYFQLSKNKKIKFGLLEFFDETILVMNKNAFWEISNCRLIYDKEYLYINSIPEFSKKKIIEKSLGHSLGAISLFAIHGEKTSGKKTSLLRAFFEGYILAKQLNDDAHDWEEDLRRGHLNYVNVKLLKTYLSDKKVHKLSFKNDFPRLRKLFWADTIQEIAKEEFFATKKARAALKKLNLSEEKYFSKLLERFDRSMQRALEESQKTLSFLKTYK